jgi:hypothetical protein
VAPSAVPSIGAVAAGLRTVNLSDAATIDVDQFDTRYAPYGLTASIASTSFGRASAALGLTASITAVTLPSFAGTAESAAFSYWEKRRKDFGQYSAHLARDLKPFWYQSDSVGVHVIRLADGTFTTADVIDEALEGTAGVRIYYGGKMNPVTDVEADELEAAGYGDYLTGRIEDAFNQGAYNEGDYGA